MKPNIRQILIWVLVISGAFCVWTFVSRIDNVREQRISYADILDMAQDGQVKDVTIDGTTLVGHYANNGQFRTTAPVNDPEMYTTFRSHGVNITNKDQNTSYWFSMLISIAPFALLLGLWVGILFFLKLFLRRRPEPPGSTV